MQCDDQTIDKIRCEESEEVYETSSNNFTSSSTHLRGICNPTSPSYEHAFAIRDGFSHRKFNTVWYRNRSPILRISFIMHFERFYFLLSMTLPSILSVFPYEFAGFLFAEALVVPGRTAILDIFNAIKYTNGVWKPLDAVARDEGPENCAKYV